MRVLSIDLDYIMGPVIELYQGLRWDDNPAIRWKMLYETSDFRDSHLYIDQSALMYCYTTFLKALKSNPTVTFGYEHDSILYGIPEGEKVDIVNIDHHDDIFHVSGFDEYAQGFDILRMEYEAICNDNYVNEGNWGAWLFSKDQLNSFHWIRNETSRNVDRTEFTRELMGDVYKIYLRDQYEFKSYDFDHIFICLSPQYIPKIHWHYFTMFIIAYEQFTGKEANLITNKKFENEFRNGAATKHNEILYKRSNGR